MGSLGLGQSWRGYWRGGSLARSSPETLKDLLSATKRPQSPMSRVTMGGSWGPAFGSDCVDTPHQPG